MRGILGWVVVLALLAAFPGHATEPRDAAWVDEQVGLGARHESEHSVDRVGWASTLPEALELARKHQRLVYLLIDRGDALRGRA